MFFDSQKQSKLALNERNFLSLIKKELSSSAHYVPWPATMIALTYLLASGFGLWGDLVWSSLKNK
jgi:hypothetical protein